MPEMTVERETSQTEAEYETLLQRCLDEMPRYRRQMEEEQQEIDRLKAETQALLTELRTL